MTDTLSFPFSYVINSVWFRGSDPKLQRKSFLYKSKMGQHLYFLSFPSSLGLGGVSLYSFGR